MQSLVLLAVLLVFLLYPEIWSVAELCSPFHSRTNKTLALQMAPVARHASQSSQAL